MTKSRKCRNHCEYAENQTYRKPATTDDPTQKDTRSDGEEKLLLADLKEGE